MNVRFIRAALVLCAGLAAMLPAPARAVAPPARNFLSQRMSGAQEVPPRETHAQGAAVYNLSLDGTQLHFQLVVTRIQNVVGAHIHSGAAGVNGPIIFGMFDAAPAGGSVNGVLSQGTIIRGVTPLPAALGATLTDAQRFDQLIALMRSGNTYTNVHTNDGVAPTNAGPGDFPGGEIRGQNIPRP